MPHLKIGREMKKLLTFGHYYVRDLSRNMGNV